MVIWGKKILISYLTGVIQNDFFASYHTPTHQTDMKNQGSNWKMFQDDKYLDPVIIHYSETEWFSYYFFLERQVASLRLRPETGQRQQCWLVWSRRGGRRRRDKQW